MSFDYPLLGEPLLIEFLNTLYIDADGQVDFLGDGALAQGWVNAVSDRLGAPVTVDAEAAAALRGLRHAIRLLTTTPDSRLKSKLVKDAIGEINRAVSLAPRVRRLGWTQSRVTLATADRPDSISSLLASLAADAVDIIGRITQNQIEVCGRPACNMLFLRQHHRRRYCNDRCASADRQSRYYRRVNPGV